jgi:hypothetical protein
MIEYRITKYNPAKRNELGLYLGKDEWTEFSEVGKNVSLEDYEKVEAAFTKSALEFLSSAEIKELNVVGLEDYQNKSRHKENDTISIDKLEKELRSLLRGDFWCKYESELGYVHVGYDYYMYIGVSSVESETIERAENRGLFVEEFTSPYHPEDC